MPSRRGVPTSTRCHSRVRPRAKRLLSGLLRCGQCGGTYIVVSRDYVGCSNHRNKGVCSNARTITMREIEDRVLVALQRHLLTPEVVAVAIEAYRAERQRLAKERVRERSRRHARDSAR